MKPQITSKNANQAEMVQEIVGYIAEILKKGQEVVELSDSHYLLIRSSLGRRASALCTEEKCTTWKV